MVTAAAIRNKLEALERGPGVQETKIFFIDAGSDEVLEAAEWGIVRDWEKKHSYRKALVIVFEEVEGRESAK